MAATAAYVDVVLVPTGSSAGESYTASNIGATTAAFTLKGGIYAMSCVASTYGTVGIQMRAANATTYLAVKDINGTTVSFSADGAVTVYLPPGTYKIALA